MLSSSLVPDGASRLETCLIKIVHMEHIISYSGSRRGAFKQDKQTKKIKDKSSMNNIRRNGTEKLTDRKVRRPRIDSQWELSLTTDPSIGLDCSTLLSQWLKIRLANLNLNFKELP